MNKESIKDSFVWVIFIAIIGYLCFLNACENDKPIVIKDNSEQIKDDKKLIDYLLKEVDSLKNIKQEVKTKYIKGKETVKILKNNVVIHDTLVVRYTDALENQIVLCDSILKIQEIEITKRDTLIKTGSRVVTLLEQDNEELQKVVSKQSKTIKRYKTASKIVAPLVGILGGLFLSLRL